MEDVNTENLYMQLNASELEAIIKKDSPSSNDRDAGFCSASSESEGGDDSYIEHLSQHASPLIRSSEEYGVIKKKSAVLVRNKRKSMEPSKVVEPVPNTAASTGPLKKRIRYTSSADSAVMLTPPTILSPPLPNNNLTSANMWDPSQVLRKIITNPAHIFVRHPGVTTLHGTIPFSSHPEQQEPLNLQSVDKSSTLQQLSTVSSESSMEQNFEDVRKDQHSSLCKSQQRNYKNMTRERRIEANARERTRVHTISAAYETLRRAVPAYASSQKLSKLSVLRVACSYILTLSRMAGKDYSSDQSEPMIADCIEAITSTIQTEGKTKRRKDE